MNAGSHPAENVRKAIRMVRMAKRRGAQLVCLPEAFSYRGDLARLFRVENAVLGPWVRPFQELAREEKVTILLGSVYEKSVKKGFCFNTSLLISSEGKITASYRKINMFEIRAGKSASTSESRYLLPGRGTRTAKVGPVTVGFSICFDLRFPELYRELGKKKTEIFFVPASFTAFTGQDHWEVLLRARAIENQVYILAPNQTGKGYSGGIESFGNSMIVDPWGNVLARAGRHREEIIYAVLSSGDINRVRKTLPVLKKRS